MILVIGVTKIILRGDINIKESTLINYVKKFTNFCYVIFFSIIVTSGYLDDMQNVKN